MAREDSELEHLSTMLRQCLSRIDAEAYRLQDPDGERLDCAGADLLEEATEELHGLVDSLLSADPAAETDVNEVVSEVASARLQRLAVPVVQRLMLAKSPARAAVTRTDLGTAVDRALTLAVNWIQPGGQLTVSTRAEPGAVVIELESLGCNLEDSVSERAETLRDFVREFGGSCTVHSEQNDLFLVLEVPRVIATEPSDRG